MTVSLTRRYRFCASHRLHSVLLSDVENVRIYGKCNNPYGHGHDYTLAVTVSGPLDPVAGILFPVSFLDRLVDDHVVRRFAHRNFNVDVAEFETVVPTTENIALVIVDSLKKNWADYIYPPSAQLTSVHVEETDRNSFEVVLPVAARRMDAHFEEVREVEGRVPVNA